METVKDGATSVARTEPEPLAMLALWFLAAWLGEVFIGRTA